MEAQGWLDKAMSVQLKAQRMVEEARSRVGAAQSHSAQTYRELGLEGQLDTTGSQNLEEKAAGKGGKDASIPEWLQVETLMELLRAGICWQEVLQKMGFGPGLRLGERPARVGEPIPKQVMFHLEVAFAVQQGYPIRVKLLPQEEEQTRVEEVTTATRVHEVLGSEPNEELFFMLLEVTTRACWVWAQSMPILFRV